MSSPSTRYSAPKWPRAVSGQADCFGMRVRAAADTVIVELHGELDLVADARLTPRMDLLSRRKRPVIVMDLSEVTFLDVCGLRLLLRARARVLDRDGTVQLVPGTPYVAKVLQLTGTAPGFRLLDRLPPELT